MVLFTLTASGGSGSYMWSATGVPGLTGQRRERCSVRHADGGGEPDARGHPDRRRQPSLVDFRRLQHDDHDRRSDDYHAFAAGRNPESCVLCRARCAAADRAPTAKAINGIAEAPTVNASTGATGGSPTVGGNLTLTVTLTRTPLNPGATPWTRQYVVTITFASLTITTPGDLGKVSLPTPSFQEPSRPQPDSPALTWECNSESLRPLTPNPATGRITATRRQIPATTLSCSGSVMRRRLLPATAPRSRSPSPGNYPGTTS